MTTDEAFAKLISQRGIHKVLQLDSNSIRQLRTRFRKNPAAVLIDTKHKLLHLAGYKMVQQTNWNAPGTDNLQPGS